MKALLIAVLMIPVVFSQTSTEKDVRALQTGNYWISMTELLGNPEKYNGKRVKVAGFVHIADEEYAIYDSIEHAEYGIAQNSFWIEFQPSVKMEALSNRYKKLKIPIIYFHCKYVMVEGVFNQNNFGHMGCSSGAIESVSSIEELMKIKPTRMR
jgi:hypothetical protein